jgi:hypothetical protein
LNQNIKLVIYTLVRCDLEVMFLTWGMTSSCEESIDFVELQSTNWWCLVTKQKGNNSSNPTAHFLSISELTHYNKKTSKPTNISSPCWSCNHCIYLHVIPYLFLFNQNLPALHYITLRYFVSLRCYLIQFVRSSLDLVELSLAWAVCQKNQSKIDHIDQAS